MRMRSSILLCFLMCATGQVMGEKMLALLPFAAKSHFIYCNGILSALAERGHHVTIIGPIGPSKPVPNVKYIEVHTQTEKDMKKMMTFEKFLEHVTFNNYYGYHAPLLWQLGYTLCEEILNHKEIQNIIASKEKFDVLIGEFLFGQESLLVLGHLLNIKIVNLNGFGPWSIINHVHGNDLQIASQPDPLSFAFTNQMTFGERFRNVLSTVATVFFYYYHHIPKHEAIIERTLKDSNIPPLNNMLINISLTLANFHNAVGYPQSVPGNIIPVAGVHIASKLPPIPKDILDFLDRGKQSVIYFSLGTVVPVHLMPPELLQTFVKVFSKLPYRVLWKIEADSVPNLPNHVKIAKWLPQQSILAHPNVVLFITHGGLLSQQEAINAGVPVVGIPFFGDQPFNVRLYEHLGIGVGLDFTSITEDSFYKAILSVVGKPRFIENAKKVSEVFQHRPMSPGDTAVFWIEYVMRHKGAHHLRPASVNLPWYSIYLLDIMAVITPLMFLLCFLIVKYVLYPCCCCCIKVKEPVSDTKKKD